MTAFTMKLVKHQTRDLYKIETTPPEVYKNIRSYFVLVLGRQAAEVRGGDEDYYRKQEIDLLVKSLNLEAV